MSALVVGGYRGPAWKVRSGHDSDMLRTSDKLVYAL
jgi:hypothetical protein